MDTITKWIVNKEDNTIELATIPASELKHYHRVRALSEGKWFDAIEAND